jgi:hypothetical protein
MEPAIELPTQERFIEAARSLGPVRSQRDLEFQMRQRIWGTWLRSALYTAAKRTADPRLLLALREYAGEERIVWLFRAARDPFWWYQPAPRLEYQSESEVVEGFGRLRF